MPFPLYQLASDLTATQRKLYQQAYESFGDFVRTQTTMRFLIDGTPGYGHQSATVALVRRFAMQLDPKGFGIGFTGTLEIYGDLDEIAPDETISLRQKIYNLIPELSGQPNGPLGQASVALKVLGTDIPGTVAAFGFSGGYDLLNTIRSEYQSLKTAHLLIIQPYKYDKVVPGTAKPGNVLFVASDGRYDGPFVIDHDFLPDGTANPYCIDLFDRALYVPIPDLSESDWRFYYDNVPATTKRVLEVLRYLSQYFQDPFSFGILYGVNYPSVSVFREPVWQRLALAASSVRQARVLDAQATRPPILVHFGAYAPGTNVEAGFDNVGSLALGAWTPNELATRRKLDDDASKTIQLTPDQRQACAAIVRIAESGTLALKPTQGDDVFRFVDAQTITDVGQLGPDLGWLREKAGRALFLQAGFVPPPVFNYYMRHIDLPAIFEGPNTAVVAISGGCTYLNADSIGHIGSGRVRYPTGTMDGATTTHDAGMLQFYANQIQADFSAWSPVASEAPSTTLGAFINLVQDPTDRYRRYFDSVHDYYDTVLNDKFSLAACILDALRLSRQDVSVALDDVPADLDALHMLLETLVAKSRSVDVLANVFPTGKIHDTYAGVLAAQGGELVIDGAVVEKTIDKDGGTNSVTLRGTTQALLIPTTAILTFTAPSAGLYCDAAFGATESWSLTGAPWIVFGDPAFHIYASASGLPARLCIETAIKSIGADVVLTFPFGGGPLKISGTFQPAKTIADFLSAVGGIDLVGQLPPPVRRLAGIGVQNLSMCYDLDALRLTDITLMIGTTSSWQLLNNLELHRVTAVTTILDPGDIKARSVATAITAILVINGKTGAGLEVSASVPALKFAGQLYGPALSVDDIINVFWPGAYPDWPGGNTPTITVLSLNYGASDGAYSGNVTLELQWPVTIAGTTILEIDSISLMLSGGKGFSSGSLSGSFVVLPNSTALGLTLTALYNGTGLGWSFEAKQTSGTLSLSDLVAEYLHWNSGLEIAVDGLGFKYETAGGSFEFSARTAGAWTIPIPTSDLTIKGSVTLGYNSGTAGTFDRPGPTLGLARVPVTGPSPRLAPLPRATALVGHPRDILAMELGLTVAATGYYAKVSADIVWKSIELTVTADLGPLSYIYTIAWGPFSGILDQTKRTVTIAFTASTTLGSMVETFISWVTGSSFGLVAPWNLLDKIPLSDFNLVWDFGKSTVSLKVGIGPIELGIARVNSINLTYVPDGDTRGAHVELAGEFRWQSEPSAPLAWNAADPSSTPAAPGQGNRYVDLRLLAAGQHVALPTVLAAVDVKTAVKEMAALTPPKAGTIPAIGFDAKTNWLFGTDFGVLRIDPPKGEAAPAKPSYVVTLQIVFDDPVLYGLRLALEGDAAKVFAGLDLQVMYRKLSDTVGVYQADITLPDRMRRIDAGAYTVTLPSFGIQIYTTGDFRFDIGFPWNQDFSRSFSIEAIIPPGIPMVGSGGFYFGKLPAVAVSQLPAATNGSFNPNLVFGFGAQLGFGKSVDYGILKAGISLTIFGIVEGLLAKWNPYDASQTGGGGALSLQGQYFFWLQGTFGILGQLYGSVDFVVVKASVNVTLKLYVQITYQSYAKIPITVYASVDATASLEINLGFFSIKINFSFSVRIKETIVVGSLQDPNDAPWMVASRTDGGRLLAPQEARLRKDVDRRSRSTLIPNWSNLAASAPVAPLHAYVGFALTIAGDDAFDPAGTTTLSKQVPCYVATLMIETTEPVRAQDRSGAAKARGSLADSSFETLVKMVLRWGIAAYETSALSAAEVDALIVSEAHLADILQAIARPSSGGAPIPTAAVEAFLAGQFLMSASLPASGSVVAAFFPMALPLTLSVPAYGTSPALAYDFAGYNAVDTDFMVWLRTYFDQLAVQVQEEDGAKRGTADIGNEPTSVGSFIFGDYFALVMRQMVQALSEGLRDFLYELQPGDTANSIVVWINTTGDLVAAKVPITLYDVFKTNDAAALTAGKVLTLAFVSHVLAESESFTTIAALPPFGGAFDARALAQANADRAGILRPGAKITYAPDAAVIIDGADALTTLAQRIGITLDLLLTDSDVLTSTSLLQPAAALDLPPFAYETQSGDTLLAVAARHGLSMMDLAGVPRDRQINPIGSQNGDVADLFDASSAPDLHIAHLAQFTVGQLICEAQRAGALQHLSGMVSRYYFHGLRLPTDKITPRHAGMWVKTSGAGELTLPPAAGLFALTGQQLPIPALATAPFTVTLARPTAQPAHDPLPWLTFAGGDTIAFTVTPPDAKVRGDLGDLSYRSYAALKAYATTHVLDSGLLSLGAAPMVHSSPMRYPLSSALPWQSDAPIAFPVGGPPAVGQPRLWPLPGAMTSLPNPTRPVGGHDPGFALEIQRYDEATGATTTAPLDHYGWASAARFTIKMLLAAGTTAAGDTYEITGAGAEDTLVLERMVSADGVASAILVLGYQALEAGSVGPLTAETSASITFGLAQVNLSKVTRPPAFDAARTKGTPTGSAPTLLNTPSEFVRLLWEACITRDGGFYLYYVDTATGDGLPSSIFDEKGQATLTFVALYPAGQRLTPSVNAVATGDPLDLSSSSLIAVAVPHSVNRIVAKDDTLQSIAESVSSTVLAVVDASPGLAFTKHAAVNLTTGTYVVSPNGAAPGGALADIARHFAMAPAAIEAANPRIPAAAWQATLPDFTAIRLPTTTLTIGVSPGGETLTALAEFYGTSATALAGANATTPDLFDVGQSLTLSTGPVAGFGARTPSIQAAGVTRAALPETPKDPSDPDYANDALLNLYTLLAYQLVPNQDFEASNLGLPLAFQAKSQGTTEASKVRFALDMTATEPLIYTTSISYLDRLVGGASGPYSANGRLLQLAYDWNDLYGNRLVTDLSVPATTFGAANRTPILLGYTDALVTLPQWPSISGAWVIKPLQEDATHFIITVDLSFDPSPFDPATEDKSNAWINRAKASLQVLTLMIGQYVDLNGIAFSLVTPLVGGAIPIPESQIGTPTSPAGTTLVGWLLAIQAFLTARADGNTAVPVPTVLTFILSVQASKAALTSQQVFPLSLTLRIERTNGVAEADFAALPGIRAAHSLVPPMTTGAASGDALREFAESVATTLSTKDVAINVATGVDRTAPLDSQTAIWGVRLGRPSSGEGISFEIEDTGAPEIYAPRPVSTTLVTRSVTIRTYRAVDDYDPKTDTLTGPEQTLALNGVDIDSWLTQFFASFDALMAPEFVSPMLVIDARAGDLPEGVDSLLSSLGATKQALAKIAADLMHPVFEQQTTDRLASAREALRQNLLTKLSNLSTTRAAISFGARVTADIPNGEAPGTSGPALFGAVTWDKDDSSIRNQVTFSSPKLLLTTGDGRPVTFLVESPQMIHAGSAGIVDRIALPLTYGGTAIEHQVAELPGIKDYRASSWLIPVLKDALAPLTASLGTFDLPMILRGFPATPRMTTQLGAASRPSASVLDDLTLWTYSFGYGLDFHFPQDAVHCVVEYNIEDAGSALARFEDSLVAMAQFIDAWPNLQVLLRQTVLGIDAMTTSQAAIDAAAQVVGAFLHMADGIVAAADGLIVRKPTARLRGSDPAPYQFTITEATETFLDEQGASLTAWVITIVSDAAPIGLSGKPYVLVDGIAFDQTHQIASASDPGRGVYAYYYMTDVGPLTGDRAQVISGRTVELPGLQIMGRQDAKATTYLARNKGLFDGRAIADAFGYQTPDVCFANPYHPTIVSDAPLDIATIGQAGPATRTLAGHLTTLFAALFETRFSGNATLQIEVAYAYALASSLADLAIPVPVALQPPLTVNVGAAEAGSLTAMIAELADAIGLWRAVYGPSELLGSFVFDVKIMSNLTRNPMPLLELTALRLPVQYIVWDRLSDAAE